MVKVHVYSCRLRLAIVAIPLLPVLLGCGTKYHIEKSVDADGSQQSRLIGNEIIIEGAQQLHSALEGDGYTLKHRCFLDPVRHLDTDGIPTYRFVLVYEGLEWLDIVPGRSLRITVGLNPTTLSARDVAKRERSGGTVTETLEYVVSEELLQTMSGDYPVRISVAGKEGEITGQFDEHNFLRIRHFNRTYIINHR